MTTRMIGIAIGLCLIVFPCAAGNWNVPGAAKELINPITKSPKTLAKGNNIYIENCASCHGKRGLGNGSEQKVSYSLQSVLTTPTEPDGNLLSDGELYWKITHGVGKMPSFAGTLTDEERWLMVNHLRNLPSPDNISRN